MNRQETLKAIESSINDLIVKDKILLQNNTSERSIAHKLAQHLSDKFKDFDVDCEYNRHLYAIKELIIPKNIITMFKRKLQEFDSYSVFPDIIIHTRTIDENNHVVIEIKKLNGDAMDKEFDIEKLKRYTLQLSYKLGVYIEFETGENYKLSSILYFQDGNQREENELKEL